MLHLGTPGQGNLVIHAQVRDLRLAYVFANQSLGEPQLKSAESEVLVESEFYPTRSPKPPGSAVS